MIDSIIPIILIFLYITFMVLLNCYKSMNIKKKDINKELLKDNPIYLLYVHGTKANKLFGLTGFVIPTNNEINEQISKYAAAQYSTAQEGNGWPTNTSTNATSPMYINLNSNSTIINALNEAKTNLNNNLLINGIRNYFDNQVLFGNASVQVIINTSSGLIAYPNFMFPLTTFLNSIQLGELPEISDSMNNETQINIPLMISWENATPLPLYGATNNGWSSDWTTNVYTIQGFQTGTNNS